MQKINLDFLGIEIPKDIAEEFIEHRKLIKKPLTQGAFKRQMKIALRAYEVGMTPDEIIEFTIDRGWQGINIEYTLAWQSRQMSAVQEAKTGSRSTTLEQELDDTSWAN